MNHKSHITARIMATLRKRDLVKQLLLDNKDNFNPGARVLMAELSRFCFVRKSAIKVSKITGSIDPIAMAVAEGRREVFMRIIDILGFSDEQALKMLEQINEQDN